jgi:hypothetical protein
MTLSEAVAKIAEALKRTVGATRQKATVTGLLKLALFRKEGLIYEAKQIAEPPTS